MKKLYIIFSFIILSGCGFDEGCVGKQNSNALREAKKYWEIKQKTVLPLQEIPIENGTKVIYSEDGEKLIVIDITIFKKA